MSKRLEFDGLDEQYDLDPSLIETETGLEIEEVTFDAGAADDGSPILEVGLIVGALDANDKYKEFDPAANDGSEKPGNAVILLEEVDVSGGDAQGRVVVQGTVRQSGLHIGTGDPLEAWDALSTSRLESV